MLGLSGDVKKKKQDEKCVLKAGLTLWPSFCFLVVSAQGMKDFSAVSAVIAVSAKL